MPRLEKQSTSTAAALLGFGPDRRGARIKTSGSPSPTRSSMRTKSASPRPVGLRAEGSKGRVKVWVQIFVLCYSSD